VTITPEVADATAPVPFTLTPKAQAALMPPADVHTWFGLSYANYLVLPRTLLQSMPLWWQHRLTAMLDDLDEAFAHVPRAEAYQVTAAVEREVSDLTADEHTAAGITAAPRCYLDHDHGDGTDCEPWMSWTDSQGRDLDPCERVLIPADDPVPAYNRGRTRVERAPGFDGGDPPPLPGVVDECQPFGDSSEVDWLRALLRAAPVARPWTAGAFPPVVCLCGSTRFHDEFRRANLRLTLAGEIVLSIGCDTKSDADLAATAELGDSPAAVKARLDELHKRKIDLADYVLVLNVGGYVGESTRSEIAYATARGKPVRYLQPVTTGARAEEGRPDA
jgi:hypothetical protein